MSLILLLSSGGPEELQDSAKIEQLLKRGEIEYKGNGLVQAKVNSTGSS